MVAAIRRKRPNPHEQTEHLVPVRAQRRPQSDGVAERPDAGGKSCCLTNEISMNLNTLQIFDPAMCCSTGVCGPEVDARLVQFAANLDWLKAQGVIVQRHNLSQDPAAFVENDAVKTALTEQGEAALPVLLLNGKVAITGRYPERAELALLCKLKATATIAPAKSECCGGGPC